MGSLKKLGALLAVLLLAAVLFVAGCSSPETKTTDGTEDKSSSAPEKETKEAVKGTVYFPGMGGHIAAAKVEIDPTNADEPIKISGLDRITLGTKEEYATHDVRIDQEKGIAYSAAYVKAPDGKVRVAKIDLNTMEKVSEVSVDPGSRYLSGPLYCASGQSKNSFLPVIMGYEGSIDVFDKETLEMKQRVYFDDPSMTKDYIFAHGVQTPDMTKFLLTLNATSKDLKEKKPPRNNPDVLMYLLDMAALEQGKLEILKSGKVTGDAAATIAFRQTYTSDGKYLLQSGRDRVMVVDGENLTLVREGMMPKENGIQVEVHDVMPIPGDKYAVLALRWPLKKIEGEKDPVMDGMMMLFDVESGKSVGKPVSVCKGCHDDYNSLKDKTAVLCGVDATWDK